VAPGKEQLIASGRTPLATTVQPARQECDSAGLKRSALAKSISSVPADAAAVRYTVAEANIDTAVARSAPAPERSCKRDNSPGGTYRRGRRALQRSRSPVSVVSSASGTECHARVGNASPNIGSPLIDSSAVASNCSTSQCSTSSPSCTRTTSTAIQFAGNPILENRPWTIT
jgi:hypothetical protein